MLNKFKANQGRFFTPSRPLSGSILGKITVFAVISLSLGACTQGSMLSSNSASPQTGPDGQVSAPEKSFNRFPDIPIPTGAEMDTKRTLVFGSGEDWYGQLTLNAKHDGDSIFDFYKQELSGFGWEEITSVRADVSSLTYMRAERVATIQIAKNTIRGSIITITISPRGGAVPK
ncbi:MAG: hypothetical protein OEW37_10515 [Rhodospirillaceae bacterium]|nr:hypothetical protein [Rhodospirillaceae bacterium]